MTLAALGVPVRPVQQRELPGHLPPDLDRVRSCCCVVLIVLYTSAPGPSTATPPYLDMWEWLWWTGLITFSMIIIESLFVFDYILVLAT